MIVLFVNNKFCSIEGGDDKSNLDFYNPLYIADDPFGGYAKLSADEKEVNFQISTRLQFFSSAIERSRMVE